MTAGRMPLALMVMLAPCPVLAANDAALCHRAAAVAAAETGVPLPVLTAIMGAETGRAPDGGSAPEPWPWALQAGGRAYWPADAHQARATLAALVAQGQRNIDIGCFQINLRWHGAAFASAADMLDPLANARHAAAYLRRLHTETGDWRRAAGAYHSRDPARAEAYVRRVEEVHLRLAPPPAPATVPPAPVPTGPLPAAAVSALVDLNRRLPPLGAP